MRRRISGVAVAVTAALGAGACGTTVSLPPSTASAGDGLSSVGSVASSAPLSGSSTASSGGLSAPAGVPGMTDSGGQAATTGSGVGHPAGTTPGGSIATGGAGASSYKAGIKGVSQGITDTTISIGVVALKNGEAFAHGLGFTISYGDTKVEFDSVINDLNTHGGIRGRKVVPVIGYEDLSQSDPQGSLCATFTQDNHVFAVLTPFNPEPSFASCVAKTHTLLINASDDAPNPNVDPAYPGWVYSPSLITYDRYPYSLVAALSQHHFFGPQAKAGVLAIDDPQWVDPAENSFKPLLERLGVQTEVVRIGANTFSSDIPNAILKFRQEGINYVFFVQSGAGVPLYFMEDADQQGYFPHYAIGTYEAAGWFLEQYAPQRQLANAEGIGWEPFFDVKASAYPKTARERQCFAIEKKGGEENKDRQANITSTEACDLVWAFADAARSAGSALTFDSWRAGYAALGTSYRSVLTFTTDFSSGRSDGSSSYRWVDWNTGCGCFRYAGPVTKDVR